MTPSLAPTTPSISRRNGNHDGISHRDTMIATLPAPGSPSAPVAVDEGVALFSSHCDVAGGNVLSLLPPTPSRDDTAAVPASSSDATKRLRSPSSSTAPPAAPTPSGRPRKMAARHRPPTSPQRAVRAVSSALASLAFVAEPPVVARMSPSAPSAIVADVFAVTPSPAAWP